MTDDLTELEQRLLDREPVSVTLSPPSSAEDSIHVEVNWGDYGFQETNPYHRIVTAWLSTLEMSFGVSEEPALKSPPRPEGYDIDE